MLSVSGLVDLSVEAKIEEMPVLRMISRRMIDAGDLPKAAGRRIPHVTHEQAALFLLGVMATPSVFRDAPQRARTYGALVFDGRPGQTALEAVAALLRRLPKDPLAFDQSLEVCTNFPQVVLKKKPLGPVMPHPSERTGNVDDDIFIPAGEDRMHWPTHGLKRFAVLSGDVLTAIAIALAAE
jgi:hypothetical protein